MTNLSAKQRVEHYYDRVPDNWYVEPREASRQLFAPEKFMGPIHDPCCGSGRIVTEARQAGYEASGAVIIDRGFPGTELIDFRMDRQPRVSLVYNAPYTDNEEFLAHALSVASHDVAIFVRIQFQVGQRRYIRFYHRCPPALVCPLSRRADCPPGGVDMPPGRIK